FSGVQGDLAIRPQQISRGLDRQAGFPRQLHDGFRQSKILAHEADTARSEEPRRLDAVLDGVDESTAAAAHLGGAALGCLAQRRQGGFAGSIKGARRLLALGVAPAAEALDERGDRHSASLAAGACRCYRDQGDEEKEGAAHGGILLWRHLGLSCFAGAYSAMPSAV